MVQWLVEDSGADPNPVDRFGRTPLEDAVRAPNRTVLHPSLALCTRSVCRLDSGQMLALCLAVVNGCDAPCMLACGGACCPHAAGHGTRPLPFMLGGVTPTVRMR